MKPNGILTFIFMVLGGAVTLFMALNMEVVLKTSSFLIGYSLIVVILSIIIFVMALKVYNKKQAYLFAIINIGVILIAVVAFILSKIPISVDYKTYSTLLSKNSSAQIAFFFTLLAQLIMGIINCILGFTYKDNIK